MKRLGKKFKSTNETVMAYECECDCSDCIPCFCDCYQGPGSYNFEVVLHAWGYSSTQAINGSAQARFNL